MNVRFSFALLLLLMSMFGCATNNSRPVLVKREMSDTLEYNTTTTGDLGIVVSSLYQAIKINFPNDSLMQSINAELYELILLNYTTKENTAKRRTFLCLGKACLAGLIGIISTVIVTSTINLENHTTWCLGYFWIFGYPVFVGFSALIGYNVGLNEAFDRNAEKEQVRMVNKFIKIYREKLNLKGKRE